MNNLEYLQNLSAEELAEWLDEHGQFDGAPWMDWFNKKYCSKCKPIKCKIEGTSLGITPLYPDREIECSYCELERKCKFFPEFDEAPDNKEIIKMWLLKKRMKGDL